MAQYRERYDFATDDLGTVRYQAREEAAMRKILEREGAMAFINNFQDLYGMKQLPGLASQNMMADGIGYGGEGDWKVAGMTAIMKKMAEGLEGGTVFMEDYTYDLAPGNEISLGAHMLEVCPSIAANRPRIEVHDLGIGDREPPARLVFEGKSGPGIVVSLIDMGGRLRMIIQDIEVIKPTLDMPNLPVARVMWKPAPDLLTGVKCWIHGRRRAPHRALHRGYGPDDDRLLRDNADRVRPHHEGQHRRGPQARAVLQRHRVEIKGVLICSNNSRRPY